jgi:hypothetical protein
MRCFLLVPSLTPSPVDVRADLSSSPSEARENQLKKKTQHAALPTQVERGLAQSHLALESVKTPHRAPDFHPHFPLPSCSDFFTYDTPLRCCTFDDIAVVVVVVMMGELSL